MRDLVGAACGTQNPLVQLSQQVRGDAARQQEGLNARMSGPGPAHQAPGTFHMAPLLRETRKVEAGLHENQWAREFQQVAPAFSATLSEWNREFASQHIPQFAHPAAVSQPERLHSSFPQHPTVTSQAGVPQGLIRTPFMPPLSGFNQQPLGFQSSTGTGTSWAEDVLTQSERKTVSEPSNLAEVAREYVKTEDKPQVRETDFYNFVENVANRVQDDRTSEQRPDRMKQDSKDDTKFWQDVTKSWTNASFNTMSEHWRQERDILPLSYQNYKFNEQTPIDENLVRNPFEEGLEKLRQGDLPSAVLLFEAAVKKDSTHIEAWQYLGTTQAQNEQDVQAIAALRRCIELDPQNLVALMSLGVSYHNEGLQRQGCEALREWLRVNPKYTHLDEGPEPQLEQGANITTMEKAMHKDITKMYIRAAQIQPENPDADVQSGLGVLLNMSFDFDKAIDCFKAAVSVRPDDARLWNRLGATLANGGRSAEAVEAYRHALQLYPGYIRARFNLGISCINLNCYDEAAEHFLSALNLQNNAKADHIALSQQSTMSNNIWNTLRMCVTLMNRPELYAYVDQRNLKELSKMFLRA